MTVTITRRLEFDYGHRLVGHESKCRNTHGHRGVVEVVCRTLTARDHLGRVIDFSVVKSVLGGWLDERWDHAFIYQHGDPIGDWLSVHDQRSYEMDEAPTAENLAALFLQISNELMRPHGIEVARVVFHETPNCKAEAAL